jgi:hypothetical protein
MKGKDISVAGKAASASSASFSPTIAGSAGLYEVRQSGGSL